MKASECRKMGETEQAEDIGYLQDIISYIFDEKKIVTYKWISNTLAVHVNRAKQLLYTFIKHTSEERLKELKVTYLVGGILPDNKGCRMLIVSEEDLEQVKTQFEVITSEHVYSVCFKTCLSDLHFLCSVDGVKDSKIVRHGAVQCTNGVPRSAEEMASNREGVYVANEDDKQWPAKQSQQQEKQASTGNDKKSSKTASSITAMFSAQNNKGKTDNKSHSKNEEEKVESVSSSDKKPTETKNAGKNSKPPANRLAAMFSAQNSRPKPIKNNIQKEDKSKNKEKSAAEETTESPKNVIPEKNKDNLSKTPQDKSSKSKVSKSGNKKSKQKKRKASDDKGEKNKKRKRIVVMDDSDSSSDDDIFGSEEDAPPSPICIDEEEMEETVESAKPQEKTQHEAVPNNSHHARKRKLVDKTFVDDEGYVVTKKVYEYVSCSEGENEEKENEKSTVDEDNKKEDSKPIDSKRDKKESISIAKEVKGAQKTRKNSPQKKNSPPEKKKQATLMSFFKRS